MPVPDHLPDETSVAGRLVSLSAPVSYTHLDVYKRQHFINAIHCAKEGKYDEAAELIKQGDEAFSLGHNVHADLLAMDANGEISNGYMLLMHAEDQLMSAEAFRILADEFITLYKRIDEK